MFPILLLRSMMKPARLKNETTFTAEDPWNQNQRVRFELDRYAMALKGAKLKPDTRPLLGVFMYGIRSEIDGVERLLPESLGYLWRKNRVPIDALPRLLKEMQPTLRKNDFNLQVLTRMHTVLLYFCLVALGFGVLTIAGSVIFAGAPMEMALAFGFIFVLVFAFFYWFLIGPRSRRKKQMAYALARV